MTGVADFSWASSKSKILPGAICENFTSFGGIMAEGSTQTPLTEFLRYGAAGSSGTIVEPMALAEKFPWPLLHVHYARGCSLAEAYYQSVFAPAQLLIVGDPLCRPWAGIPAVQAEGVKPDGKVSGTIRLTPTAKVPNEGTVDRFELFVDGRRVTSAAPGESLHWDTNSDADGYHELRVVAIDASSVQTTGRADFSGHGGELRLSHGAHHGAGRTRAMGRKPDRQGQGPRHEAGLRRAERPPIGSHYRAKRANWPSIRARSGWDPFPSRPWRSGRPARANAWFPRRRKLSSSRPKRSHRSPTRRKTSAPGFAFKLPNGKIVTVQDTRDPAWPALLGLEQNQPFVGQAYFDVADGRRLSISGLALRSTQAERRRGFAVRRPARQLQAEVPARGPGAGPPSSQLQRPRGLRGQAANPVRRPRAR